MAAPVKNFTDPTTLSKLGPDVPMPLVQPGIPTFGMSQTICLIWNPYPWALTQLGTMGPKPVIQEALRIPTPPMGRQMVLTFPPVYRSNDGNAGGAGSLYNTPRVFPPIFIDATGR
jgi:hypothetical protein